MCNRNPIERGFSSSYLSMLRLEPPTHLTSPGSRLRCTVHSPLDLINISYHNLSSSWHVNGTSVHIRQADYFFDFVAKKWREKELNVKIVAIQELGLAKWRQLVLTQHATQYAAMWHTAMSICSFPFRIALGRAECDLILRYLLLRTETTSVQLRPSLWLWLWD